VAWLVAGSPVAMLGVSVPLEGSPGGRLPPSSAEISGSAAWGLIIALVLLVMAGLGEETGWRGFAGRFFRRLRGCARRPWARFAG
jgi:membrane protease YdiL (CAAX protease family)